VGYAAGAFNWRVKVGDITEITDYQANEQKISAEKTAQEVTWSLAQKVPKALVEKWFNKTLFNPSALNRQNQHDNIMREMGFKYDKQQLSYFFIAILWLINMPLIAAGSGSFVLTGIATIVLWILALGT